MRDMAHSICLTKLYQITMRKKFRFFVSDYLNSDIPSVTTHPCYFCPTLPYYSSLMNFYFMNTYVLLHFEHKNDVTITVKLLYRVPSKLPRTRTSTLLNSFWIQSPRETDLLTVNERKRKFCCIIFEFVFAFSVLYVGVSVTSTVAPISMVYVQFHFSFGVGCHSLFFHCVNTIIMCYFFHFSVAGSMFLASCLLFRFLKLTKLTVFYVCWCPFQVHRSV